MFDPPQSLHRLLRRWCWQRLVPPQSLHWLLCRWCWQMLVPPQSLHWLLCRWCWHILLRACMLLPGFGNRSPLCRLFDSSPLFGVIHFLFEVLAFPCVPGAISTLVFMLIQVDRMSAERLQLACSFSIRRKQGLLLCKSKPRQRGPTASPNLGSLPLWTSRDVESTPDAPAAGFCPCTVSLPLS